MSSYGQVMFVRDSSIGGSGGDGLVRVVWCIMHSMRADCGRLSRAVELGWDTQCLGSVPSREEQPSRDKSSHHHLHSSPFICPSYRIVTDISVFIILRTPLDPPLDLLTLVTLRVNLRQWRESTGGNVLLLSRKLLSSSNGIYSGYSIALVRSQDHVPESVYPKMMIVLGASLEIPHHGSQKALQWHSVVVDRCVCGPKLMSRRQTAAKAK
ncbi:hypothetical protein Tco_1173195 [Tanacetum coccineum]